MSQEISFDTLVEGMRAFELKEWRKVISLLESWPVSIAVLIRSDSQNALDLEVKEILVRAMTMLGHAYVEMKDDENAEQVLRLSIRMMPDSELAAPAYLKIGQLLYAAEQSAEAISYFRRAISLGDTSEVPYAYLAKVYHVCGRQVAAGVCAELACRINPKSDVQEIKQYVEASLAEGWQVVVDELARHDISSATMPLMDASERGKSPVKKSESNM